MSVPVRQASFLSLLHLMSEVGPGGRTTCLVLLIGIRAGGCTSTRKLFLSCLRAFFIGKSPHFRPLSDYLGNYLFHLKLCGWSPLQTLYCVLNLPFFFSRALALEETVINSNRNDEFSSLARSLFNCAFLLLLWE